MPSKSYIAPETAFTWTEAGTGSDNLLDLGGLASNAVACGSYQDLGSASRPDIYEVEFFIDGFESAPVVGETVDLFFTQSNATTGFDGAPSTDPTSSAQGTVALAATPNLLYAGSVTVVTTTAADNLRARFVVRLTSRYVAPVVANRTTDPLLGTADAHRVILTPIPAEGQ